MRKCGRTRNRTWDLLITKKTLCHLSYLGTITWPTISHIVRVGLSSHSAYSRLERWEREKFLKAWTTKINSVCSALKNKYFKKQQNMKCACHIAKLVIIKVKQRDSQVYLHSCSDLINIYVRVLSYFHLKISMEKFEKFFGNRVMYSVSISSFYTY